MSMLRSSSASIKEEAVTQTSFFTAPSPTYSTFLANAAGTPGDYFSIAQSPQSLLQSVNSPMIPPGTPGTPLDSLSAIATQISHQESGVLRASTDSFHQPEEPAIVSIKTEPTNEANDTRRSRRSTSPTRDIKLSVPPRRRSKTMSRSGKNGSPHEPVDQQLLLLTQQTGNMTELAEMDGTDVTVYVVVKNSPFKLIIESDDLNVQSLNWQCELIYDNPERLPVTTMTTAPMTFKKYTSKTTKNDKRVRLDCKIAVLSTQHEHQRFRVLVTCYNKDKLVEGAYVVSHAIRVISKMDRSGNKHASATPIKRKASTVPTDMTKRARSSSFQSSAEVTPSSASSSHAVAATPLNNHNNNTDALLSNGTAHQTRARLAGKSLPSNGAVLSNGHATSAAATQADDVLATLRRIELNQLNEMAALNDIKLSMTNSVVPNKTVVNNTTVVAPSPMRTYIATPVSNEANSVAGVLRARLLDVFKVLDGLSPEEATTASRTALDGLSATHASTLSALVDAMRVPTAAVAGTKADATDKKPVCTCDPCPYKLELAQIDELYLSFCQ
eukprot:CAMPEP_0168598452 /NCGR_PEP_ID=MMETSP0420-20121227/11406_1 /TAXON_ID=498008 /ORGANISM="Pessonella sp." /LENGTH=555 /DNA_ID=CAMNT_0008635773 /DNA_START=87 /DNA_END=1754 /DNA_ORIENTATION=-